MFGVKEGKTRLGVLGLLVVVSFVLSGCKDYKPVIVSGFPTGPIEIDGSRRQKDIPIVIEVPISYDYYIDNGGEISLEFTDQGPVNISSVCEGLVKNNQDFPEMECLIYYSEGYDRFAPGIKTASFVIRSTIPGAKENGFYHSDVSEPYTLDFLSPKIPAYISIYSISWAGKDNGTPFTRDAKMTFSGFLDDNGRFSLVEEPPQATGDIIVTVGGVSTCVIPVNKIVNTCELVFSGYAEGLPLVIDVNFSYAGDENYEAITYAEALTIDYLLSPVSASTSPNPSAVGEAVSVDVEVPGVFFPSTNGLLLPTGEVFIKIWDPAGPVECTVDLTPQTETGVSTTSCYSWVPSAEGEFQIEVYYGGDSVLSGGSVGITHTVGKLESTTSIDSVNPPNLVQVGESAIFFVSVSGSGATPTGTVDVSGAGGSCTVTLDANGEGNCSYTMNSAGQFTIMATYSGDGDYDESSTTESYGVVAPPDPDTDGDGIPDSKDSCPNQGDNGYGLEANGCPTLG